MLDNVLGCPHAQVWGIGKREICPLPCHRLAVSPQATDCQTHRARWGRGTFPPLGVSD